MIHESKENINRRDFFKNLAFLSLVTFSTKSLYAKGSKKRFEYQDTPKNGKACKDCIHFESETNTCKIIEGSISPQGWCNLYMEKPQ
ncbi:iron oxidase oxidoreductase [Campylobacterota bacterium DY0563]|uniref:iron oxidase oxidoreductase n=1 Tax=Halarcobacter sp. TaxID=2321133 RepID=UPI0029F549E0|nr:iron oxidase oxidoreductase [Halarcobacter sp.]